ncbi:MAG TPA: T9SS type A sorting domain-containing protein, partial [Crocinitomix sp.]|nr:T9SS type A sorting domain-containing protein [Crocinitomix sp.]
SYYRLKQTDFDGKVSYSNIVSVDRKSDSNISIYPNPTNNIVNLSIDMNNYTVNVYGLDGRLILTEASAKQIDLSELANGVYQFVIISNTEIVKTVKIIKQ